jgi:hypothetical protein
MASLTQTRTLNLSFSTVNFWETGPRSPHTFILKSPSEDDLASDRIAQLATKIIRNEKPDLGVIITQKGTPAYRAFTSKEQEDQWAMVQAIYQGQPFPEIQETLFLDGMDKLNEINQLMIEQMEFIQKGGDITKVAGIIDRGEEIIEAICNLVPALGVLIRWYQTEKTRIAPGDTFQVLEKTVSIHHLMKKVLEIYQTPEIEAVENL